MDIFGRVVKLLKALKDFPDVSSEIELEKRCADDIMKKRKLALKRARERAKYSKKGPIISDWDPEIDPYANDEFFKRKLEECHRANSLVRRAMGDEI